MKRYGPILYACNDPALARATAASLRDRGVSCEITAGLDTVYAAREVSHGWHPAYASWRAAFAQWLLERTGARLQ